jgi:hypothetical protein
MVMGLVPEDRPRPVTEHQPGPILENYWRPTGNTEVGNQDLDRYQRTNWNRSQKYDRSGLRGPTETKTGTRFGGQKNYGAHVNPKNGIYC